MKDINKIIKLLSVHTILLEELVKKGKDWLKSDA